MVKLKTRMNAGNHPATGNDCSNVSRQVYTVYSYSLFLCKQLHESMIVGSNNNVPKRWSSHY